MTVKCLIDDTEHKSIVSLARYLKKLGVSNKDYYDQYLRTDGDGICPECGKETDFIKFKYKQFCDYRCSTKYNGRKLRGVPISEEKKKQISESWKTRDPSWLQRREETYQQKYGMSFADHKRILWNERLSKMTVEEKTEFYDNCVSSQGKSKSRKYKSYMMGEREVLVQGYEPFVLDVLRKFYDDSEIVVERSKECMVKYVGTDGKMHNYFPDIFLPDNVIIEVKSPYTLKNNLETTLLKMKASYERGYRPILVVWEKNSERMEMCEKSLIETISSQAWNCTGRFNDYPFIGVGYKQTVSEVLGIPVEGIMI